MWCSKKQLCNPLRGEVPGTVSRFALGPIDDKIWSWPKSNHRLNVRPPPRRRLLARGHQVNEHLSSQKATLGTSAAMPTAELKKAMTLDGR